MTKAFRIGLPIAVIVLLFMFGLSISTNVAQDTNTGGANFGSNWSAVYFNDTNLGSIAASLSNIAAVNFSYGTNAPIQGVNADNFSIRFTSLELFATGTYRFTARADDGVRVRIDGSTIIDEFRETGIDNLYTRDVMITEGTREIIVEFVDFTGNATIQFFWEPLTVQATATDGPSPTPTATGLPPIPPGALTATVIRAQVLNTRDAPSLGGNPVRRILRGQTYQIVGRDPDARWFLLELGGGVQAWAYGYYLFVNGNEFVAPIRSAAVVFGIPPGFTDTGVLVQVCAAMRMRAEPNLASPQTGRITWGSFLPVVARTPAGDWYQVLWKGTIGWMYSGFTWIRQGDYANIPVVQGQGASNNARNFPPFSECTSGENADN